MPLRSRFGWACGVKESVLSSQTAVIMRRWLVGSLFVSETTLMSPHKNNLFLGRHDVWSAHSPANGLTTGTDFWLRRLGVCRAITHPAWFRLALQNQHRRSNDAKHEDKATCDVKEATFIIYSLVWETTWTRASPCEKNTRFAPQAVSQS